MKKTIILASMGIIIAAVVALPTTTNAAEGDSAEATKTLTQQQDHSAIALKYAGTNKAFATRVRIAALASKKAYHEARQDIEAIKKGDQSPVEDLPCFQCDEDDDDDKNNDDQEEKGPKEKGPKLKN